MEVVPVEHITVILPIAMVSLGHNVEPVAVVVDLLLWTVFRLQVLVDVDLMDASLWCVIRYRVKVHPLILRTKTYEVF